MSFNVCFDNRLVSFVFSSAMLVIISNRQRFGCVFVLSEKLNFFINKTIQIFIFGHNVEDYLWNDTLSTLIVVLIQSIKTILIIIFEKYLSTNYIHIKIIYTFAAKIPVQKGKTENVHQKKLFGPQILVYNL